MVKVGRCVHDEQGVEFAHGPCHRGDNFFTCFSIHRFFFLKFAKCNRGGGAIGRNGSAEGRGDDEDAAGGEGHRLPQGLHRRLPSICPTFSLTVFTFVIPVCTLLNNSRGRPGPSMLRFQSWRQHSIRKEQENHRTWVSFFAYLVAEACDHWSSCIK